MSAAEGTEYRIQGATADHESVEAWSTSRLPFEPTKVTARPWLPQFRSRLREEVKKLPAVPGEMLIVQFATDETQLFDAENVLLYNVGLDAFRRSGYDGVRFERRDWAWAPNGLDGAHCYHRYSFGPSESSAGGVALARWSGVPLDAFARDPSASLAWLAMRTAEVEVAAPVAIGSRFAVHMTLDVPAGSSASAVQLLKPLLDGTISAFHDYVGEDLDRMSLRLAEVLREEQPRIRSLLVGAGVALLGPRRVIGGWGATTQWNPADDLCTSGSLIVRRGDAPTWRLTGALTSIG